MKSLGLNAAAVGNLDLSQFPHHKGGAMTTLTLLGYTLKTAEHMKVLPTSWPQCGAGNSNGPHGPAAAAEAVGRGAW